MTIVE